MSDMKTFTVRDLDREPAAVLDACDREGKVLIRRRDGRVYRLEPERERRVITELPDFAGRRSRIFPKALSAAQSASLDRLVGGE